KLHKNEISKAKHDSEISLYKPLKNNVESLIEKLTKLDINEDNQKLKEQNNQLNMKINKYHNIIQKTYGFFNLDRIDFDKLSDLVIELNNVCEV
ncbi:6432_t:CDS:2, partial [Dentiscutata erythropus]